MYLRVILTNAFPLWIYRNYNAIVKLAKLKFQRLLYYKRYKSRDVSTDGQFILLRKSENLGYNHIGECGNLVFLSIVDYVNHSERNI